MQSLATFFTFLDQCCDAQSYLVYGQFCAETGECYSELRPAGAIYWFSLPFRFGISPSAFLISIHLALAILSVILSVMAVKKFLCRTLPPGVYKKNWTLLFFCSVMSHAVFLYPVTRVALSDTPANLLFLISIWLLLLLPSEKWSGFIVVACAGLCLGLAAWIRVFFIYPVLIAVFCGFVFPLYKRNFVAMGLLLALWPLGAQMFATWKKTGVYSYLDKTASAGALEFHLDSSVRGYDTLLPAQGYNWESACKQNITFIKAIHEYDLYSLQCLIRGRVNFYMGSYAPLTYTPSQGGTSRIWSSWILMANCLACIGALLFFVRLHKQVNPVQWLAPTLLLLSAGMALVIIPEQRFVIAPMISMWVFFFAWLFLFLMSRSKTGI